MRLQLSAREHLGARSLALVRVTVASIWIIKLVADPFTYMAEFSAATFRPYGILKVLPVSFWEIVVNPTVLITLKVALLALLLLLLIGAKPFPLVAISTAMLLTLHQGLVRGFTHPNHQELAALMCTYVLAVFPAADRFSWPKRRHEPAPQAIYAAAIVSMSTIALLPYSAIAAYRISHSAPAIFSGDSMPYWLGQLSGLNVDGLNLGLKLLEYPALFPLLKFGFRGYDLVGAARPA